MPQDNEAPQHSEQSAANEAAPVLTIPEAKKGSL
jgi:hypothetical protein